MDFRKCIISTLDGSIGTSFFYLINMMKQHYAENEENLFLEFLAQRSVVTQTIFSILYLVYALTSYKYRNKF